MMTKLIFAAILTITAAAAIPAHCADSVRMLAPGAPGEDPIPVGWELVAKEGVPVVFTEREDDTTYVCLKSKNSSFSIQREIDVDVVKFPYLTWKWKVDELPKGGDVRSGGKDDQAAQMFVAFGRKSISYIWDTTAPVGTKAEHWVPMVVTIKILVVESGDKNAGKWMSVTRNVYEDYRSLYGKEPPKATGLRFQINSQHTGTSAESCLESVEFRKSP